MGLIMRLSQNITRTLRDTPADEVSRNAQLLIRAGFVYKVMAGVYAYTPLGLRVLENIKQIVREEMNQVGSQELIMSSLQRKDTWEATGRWSDEVVDIWFKSELKDGTEVGFGWSHEEAIVEMAKQYVKSYKDLPVSVYQFQTKLRNEMRAKSGIMRGREFVMKDMYSMHATAEDCDAYYDRVVEAYKRIYDRLGIGDSTFVTFASGGAFTKFSHEFQTICSAGEDTLYVNADQTIAVNEEVLDEAAKEMEIDKALLKPVVSAEVGNIFKFGTEKSEQMEFYYTGEDGKRHPVYLASYGVGVTRVMGVIVEKFADEKGIVWPEAIAPAKVYLVQIGDDSKRRADELYESLKGRGIEVIYDDRDERPGAKFADAELMGIPYRVTVSDRLMTSDQYEFTSRATRVTELLTHSELLAKLS